MAIYVSPSTRRRRLVLVVAAGVLVGLLAGFGLGRATSSGIDAAVDGVRDRAADAAVALQRIPIEYEQATTGTGGESVTTITNAIDRARSELERAWTEADWFGPGVRGPVDDALAALDAAARDVVSLAAFGDAVERVVAAVEAAFGINVAGAG